METKEQKALFTLTVEEAAEAIGMSVLDFKNAAMDYAPQEPKNFKQSWWRWNTGRQSMPINVEDYIRDIHGYDDQFQDNHESLVTKQTKLFGELSNNISAYIAAIQSKA